MLIKNMCARESSFQHVCT